MTSLKVLLRKVLRTPASADICPVCKEDPVLWWMDGGTRQCSQEHLWYVDHNGVVQHGEYKYPYAPEPPKYPVAYDRYAFP